MAIILTDNPRKTADTSFATARYIGENTWGVTPTTTTNTNKWKEMRFTAESLNFDRQTTISNEIRQDRQVVDLIATNVETGGTVSGEFSYNTYDDFLCAVMLNQWVDTNTAAAVSVAATAPSGADSGYKHGKFVFTAPGKIKFINGQLILVSGFPAAQSANNGVFIIRGITVLNSVGAGYTFTLELSKDSAQDADSSVDVVTGTGPAVSIVGKYLTNGTLQKNIPAFSIEKWMSDIGQSIVYTGMAVDKFSLNVEHENIITNELTFMGKYGSTSATEVATNVVPAGKTNVFNAGDNGGVVEQDGKTSSLIANMTLDMMNNLRGKAAIGSIGNFAIGVGQFNVNGSITLYFKDNLAYKQFRDNEETSIRFNLLNRVKDTGGGVTKRGYGFYIPRAKYANASVSFDSSNSDVMMEGSYQGLLENVNVLDFNKITPFAGSIGTITTTVVISKV